MKKIESSRKGIILAGGTGTRLYPITQSISKQLLPIYDKPMIYHPLTTLMLAGIRDILLITKPEEKNLFERLFRDGNHLGINITYETQQNPNGIAEAFLIGEAFIENKNVALILGDNLFHGDGIAEQLSIADSQIYGGTIFAYSVRDPRRYGVVDFDANGKALSIEEKPKIPSSTYAVTGLYFYDNSIMEKAIKVVPSERGELEITSINKMYLDEGNLNVQILGRGTAWLDTGTFDSLHEAGAYIKTLEHRQDVKIGCPEEIAWRQGWINDKNLEELAQDLLKSGYGDYLLNIMKQRKS